MAGLIPHGIIFDDQVKRVLSHKERIGGLQGPPNSGYGGYGLKIREVRKSLTSKSTSLLLFVVGFCFFCLINLMNTPTSDHQLGLGTQRTW